MVNLIVGRAGTDIEIASVSDVTLDGSDLSLRGHTWELSYGEAARLREQMVAYADGGGESVVPIRCIDMPELDGFYTVDSVSVSAANGRATFGIFDFSLRATRVRGFAAPLFESIIQGITRPGFDGASTPFHSLPAAVKGYETWVATPTSVTRPSETGDVVVFTSGSLYERATVQYFVPGENWYDGAATVSVNGSVVTGVQIINAPTGWMLSNGRVRLVGEPGGWFRTERWDGSKWASPGAWAPARRIGTGLGATYPAMETPHTLTVVRNTPQRVGIRLTTDAASVVPGEHFPVYVDIELRRGALMANIMLDARGAYTWALRTPIVNADQQLVTSGVVEGVFVAGRLVSHGITSSDGLSVISATFPSNVLNVGAGYLPVESTDSVAFGQAVVNQWGFAQDETVTVVAR